MQQVPPFCHLITKIYQSLQVHACPASFEQTPASIAANILLILRTHQNLTSF